MDIANLDRATAFTTADGSTIRELFGPACVVAANQSLADRVRAAFPDEPLKVYEAEFEGAKLRAVLGAPERARSAGVEKRRT